MKNDWLKTCLCKLKNSKKIALDIYSYKKDTLKKIEA